MKKTAFLFVSLFLISCGQSNKLEKTDSPSKIQVFEAGIGIFTGNANFGEVSSNHTKMMTLKLTNSGNELLIGPPQIDNSNFSIVTHTGCASIAPKSSCTIKVLFDARNKTSGSFSSNLHLDTAFIELSASIAPLAPSNGASFSVSGNPVTSLNYGSITNKQNVMKSISITNIGNTSVNEPVVISGDYTIAYDTCSSKVLAPNKTCSLKVTLSGAGKSGEITGSISYASSSLSLAAQVEASQGSNNNSSSNIVAIYQSEQVASFNLGKIDSSSSKQAIINLKNIGNLASLPSSVSLSNNNFSILFDQCSNKSLAPNSSCQVRVLFSASGKALGNYSSSLSMGVYSLPLSAEVFVPGNSEVAQELLFEPGDSIVAFGTSGNGRVGARNFSVGANTSLSAISVYVTNHAGIPSEMSVKIFQGNETEDLGSEPIGMGTIEITSLPGNDSYEEVKIQLDSPINLIAGQPYIFEILRPNGHPALQSRSNNVPEGTKGWYDFTVMSTSYAIFYKLWQ